MDTPTADAGVGERALDALAGLYRGMFTGLVLSVVTRRGEADAARYVHAVFRHQHERMFLPGLRKLGLEDRPPAVACAAYHTLANRIGGAAVEFVPERDDKAWVVFPPPRWIWDGVAICAVPSSVARGMLTGWYARNGISLRVSDLRFVVTGQLVDGDFGLAGYFERTGRDLGPDERLAFRPGEQPPRTGGGDALALPGAWPAARLAAARRNYAMEYVRSALPRLDELFGTADAAHLARHTGRLVGAQLYGGVAEAWGVRGRSPADFANLLCRWAALEGDAADARGGFVERRGWRLAHGVEHSGGALAAGWEGLVHGAALAHDRDLCVAVEERARGRDGTWRWSVRCASNATGEAIG
ncbi:hypothetical protein [Acuticoccus sp.]|uniref:hypothetical protein n=1 Tax=Acuticoccus sp. TaxID=1904378 RepID=UPI003B51C5F5